MKFDCDEFTKADLKDGMIVELRNGERLIVANGFLLGFNRTFHIDSVYKDDLSHTVYKYFDIIEVYKVTVGFCLDNNKFPLDYLGRIWEHKEVERLNLNEAIKLIKELTGKDYMIVND